MEGVLDLRGMTRTEITSTVNTANMMLIDAIDFDFIVFLFMHHIAQSVSAS